MSPWRRRLLRALSALVLLATSLFVAGYFLFNSLWLREQIRLRALREISTATGGRPEIGRFDFDPQTWHITLDNLVLHGTEPTTAPPLFRAPRVTLGLKFLSFLNRKVDLKSILVENPELHLLRQPDGSLNLPSPARSAPRQAAPLAEILRLAVDEFTVRNGTFAYEQKLESFAFAGRDLEANFTYSAGDLRYDGALRSRNFALDLPPQLHFAGDFSTELSLYENSVTIAKLHLDSGRHSVEGFGAILNLNNPQVNLKLSARSDLAETKLGSGPIASNGTLTYSAAENYRYEGQASGNDLQTKLLNGVNVRSEVLVTPAGARLTRVELTSPEGRFSGDVNLPRFQSIEAKGSLADLSLAAVVSRLDLAPLPYSGAISGPVELAGPLAGPYRARADLAIVPGSTGIPVEGAVHLQYHQAQNLLAVAESYVSTPNTRITASGTLNQTIRVKATTNRLADLPLKELPLSLAEGGDIQFQGTVTGDVRSPQLAGNLRVRQVQLDKYLVESLASTVVVYPTRLDFSGLTARVEKAHLEGSGSILLADWKPLPTAPLTARLTARNVSFKLIPADLPMVGFVNGSAVISGTLNAPDIAATLDAPKPIIREEVFDHIRATVRLHAPDLTVSSFEVARGPARLTGSGRATENGPFSATVNLAGVSIAEWKDIRALQPELAGQLRGTAELAGVLAGRDPQLTSLNLDATLRGLTLAKKPLGDLTVQGKTQDRNFAFTAAGKLRETPFQTTGAYRLVPGYPGSATFSLGALPLSVWNDFQIVPLPFTGTLSASGRLSGPALNPDKWQGELTIPKLALRPARAQRITRTANAQDFELRNDGPLEFSAERGVITVKRARFLAKDTNLSAAGTFSLAAKQPWDLRVNGSLNLAGLKTFSPELVAGGVATLEANVRGALDDPQLFGRLDLKDASLFVEDLPTGLDKVNGRVNFDRRRATIENKLTAQSGGGDLALSGFIEFGEAETFYRLQANATGVRIRYPEGLSTVADGSISLTGSPVQSLLAGNVTIQRSGFQARTDLGSLLSDASRGQQNAISTNEFLTNMQLDIRVRTAPNTKFTTSLTSDVQADASLNVRGSAIRPVVQGRIAVNQGEVNFFGSKYTIKRGEISFYNTSKIEPVLDMDFETRIRAVTVGINFSGPVNKLNVSYRSDPPLAPSEIIALLTVGRSPDSASYTSPGSQSGNLFQTGANTLLGNAIAAPISSQLQRFFGVSRIKIDPLISGLEGTPQARLTVEQQVSKDITMTFVTTLNRSQQQVVRLEWNLSKEWSVIALRDENGSFGLDFQLRKQVR